MSPRVVDGDVAAGSAGAAAGRADDRRQGVADHQSVGLAGQAEAHRRIAAAAADRLGEDAVGVGAGRSDLAAVGDGDVAAIAAVAADAADRDQRSVGRRTDQDVGGKDEAAVAAAAADRLGEDADAAFARGLNEAAIVDVITVPPVLPSPPIAPKLKPKVPLSLLPAIAVSDRIDELLPPPPPRLCAKMP